MSSEILVKVEGVSKKFCRSLKKSLWYGVHDIFSELNPLRRSQNGLFKASNSKVHTNNPQSAFHNSNGLRSDEFWAVNNVSFELRRGECLGLIGRNGAGKTTLLKMLNGLIKPDRGRIEIGGRVGALIALGAGFNPILTGRENIYVNGSVLGISKWEIDSKMGEIIDFAEIGDFIDAPVQSYSSGMVVRLGFAVATALQPDILFLDEVLAVGDVAFQAKCFNRIGEFRRNGTGFILVSHNLHQIIRFCDRTMFLNKGESVYTGDTEKAVELFQYEMMRTQISERISPPRKETMGSGAVTIEKVFFCNIKEQRVTEIDSLESVTLCVEFSVHRSGILNPVLDIAIRDSADICFQGTNRSFGYEFGEFPRQGVIKVRFEKIPANNQNIQINIAIWDTNFSELFDWKRDNRLFVRGNPSCSGRTLLDCSWHVMTMDNNKISQDQLIPCVP